jgi:hypothetical protein
VAERLKAALLKSAELQDSVGSNPTLSATASSVDRPTPALAPGLLAYAPFRARAPVLGRRLDLDRPRRREVLWLLRSSFDAFALDACRRRGSRAHARMSRS